MASDEFKHMNVKLDRIESSLANMDKTLAVNTAQLAEHIKRTAILEEEVAPIKAHVQQVSGAGKLLAIIALLAAIVEGFSLFWHK